MKYFIAITLITAVASVPAVSPLRSQEINVTIQSHSNNSDTNAALKQMLLNPSPMSVVEANPTASGHPLVQILVTIHQGTATTSPVTVGPIHVHIGESESKFVQEVEASPNGTLIAITDHHPVNIIVNIDRVTSTSRPIFVGPIDVHVAKTTLNGGVTYVFVKPIKIREPKK